MFRKHHPFQTLQDISQLVQYDEAEVISCARMGEKERVRCAARAKLYISFIFNIYFCQTVMPPFTPTQNHTKTKKQ